MEGRTQDSAMGNWLAGGGKRVLAFLAVVAAATWGISMVANSSDGSDVQSVAVVNSTTESANVRLVDPKNTLKT
ncbi:MAG: hypothetical protein Q3976_09400 [Corynebacterium sp.]|nr:hypothetical protein [Corynebacterium sp.]